jgi:hypothetical protein
MLLVSGPPHIYASHLDALPLNFRHLGSEKLIERFLLAILSEPQRLAGSQVADHGNELHLLAKVDLIHTHLFQRLLATRGTPTLQIPQVDRSHRAGNQPELPSIRVALTSFNWLDGGKASSRHWRGRRKPVIPVLGSNWYRGRTH